MARLQEAAAQRDALGSRLLDLELRFNKLSALVEQLAERDPAETAVAPSVGPTAVLPGPPDDSEARMQRLLDAGLDPVQIQQIQDQESEWAMGRLYLRDRATLEGWLGTDRYNEEARALALQQETARGEVGNDVYDRYLYASGRPNRIRISSVINGSPAEQAGLLPEDVIVSYGGQPILDYDDLTRAIGAGDPGEWVRVTVLREDYTTSLTVPRGPLGVRLAALRLQP